MTSYKVDSHLPPSILSTDEVSYQENKLDESTVVVVEHHDTNANSRGHQSPSASQSFIDFSTILNVLGSKGIEILRHKLSQGEGASREDFVEIIYHLCSHNDPHLQFPEEEDDAIEEKKNIIDNSKRTIAYGENSDEGKFENESHYMPNRTHEEKQYRGEKVEAQSEAEVATEVQRHISLFERSLTPYQQLFVSSLGKLFSLIDVNDNGDVSWGEFIAYLIHSLESGTQTNGVGGCDTGVADIPLKRQLRYVGDVRLPTKHVSKASILLAGAWGKYVVLETTKDPFLATAMVTNNNNMTDSKTKECEEEMILSCNISEPQQPSSAYADNQESPFTKDAMLHHLSAPKGLRLKYSSRITLIQPVKQAAALLAFSLSEKAEKKGDTTAALKTAIKMGKQYHPPLVASPSSQDVFYNTQRSPATIVSEYHSKYEIDAMVFVDRLASPSSSSNNLLGSKAFQLKEIENVQVGKEKLLLSAMYEERFLCCTTVDERLLFLNVVENPLSAQSEFLTPFNLLAEHSLSCETSAAGWRGNASGTTPAYQSSRAGMRSFFPASSVVSSSYGKKIGRCKCLTWDPSTPSYIYCGGMNGFLSIVDTSFAKYHRIPQIVSQYDVFSHLDSTAEFLQMLMIPDGGGSHCLVCSSTSGHVRLFDPHRGCDLGELYVSSSYSSSATDGMITGGRMREAVYSASSASLLAPVHVMAYNQEYGLLLTAGIGDSCPLVWYPGAIRERFITRLGGKLGGAHDSSTVTMRKTRRTIGNEIGSSYKEMMEGKGCMSYSTLRSPSKQQVMDLKMIENSPYVVTISYGGLIHIWDLRNMSLCVSQRLDGCLRGQSDEAGAKFYGVQPIPIDCDTDLKRAGEVGRNEEDSCAEILQGRAIAIEPTRGEIMAYCCEMGNQINARRAQSEHPQACGTQVLHCFQSLDTCSKDPFATHDDCLSTCNGCQYGITQLAGPLAFHNGSEPHFITCSYSSVRLWDALTGQLICTVSPELVISSKTLAMEDQMERRLVDSDSEVGNLDEGSEKKNTASVKRRRRLSIAGMTSYRVRSQRSAKPWAITKKKDKLNISESIRMRITAFAIESSEKRFFIGTNYGHVMMYSTFTGGLAGQCCRHTENLERDSSPREAEGEGRDRSIKALLLTRECLFSLSSNGLIYICNISGDRVVFLIKLSGGLGRTNVPLTDATDSRDGPRHQQRSHSFFAHSDTLRASPKERKRKNENTLFSSSSLLTSSLPQLSYITSMSLSACMKIAALTISNSLVEVRDISPFVTEGNGEVNKSATGATCLTVLKLYKSNAYINSNETDEFSTEKSNNTINSNRLTMFDLSLQRRSRDVLLHVDDTPISILICEPFPFAIVGDNSGCLHLIAMPPHTMSVEDNVETRPGGDHTATLYHWQLPSASEGVTPSDSIQFIDATYTLIVSSEEGLIYLWDLKNLLNYHLLHHRFNSTSVPHGVSAYEMDQRQSSISRNDARAILIRRFDVTTGNTPFAGVRVLTGAQKGEKGALAFFLGVGVSNRVTFLSLEGRYLGSLSQGRGTSAFHSAVERYEQQTFFEDQCKCGIISKWEMEKEEMVELPQRTYLVSDFLEKVDDTGGRREASATVDQSMEDKDIPKALNGVISDEKNEGEVVTILPSENGIVVDVDYMKNSQEDKKNASVSIPISKVTRAKSLTTAKLDFILLTRSDFTLLQQDNLPSSTINGSGGQLSPEHYEHLNAEDAGDRNDKGSLRSTSGAFSEYPYPTPPSTPTGWKDRRCKTTVMNGGRRCTQNPKKCLSLEEGKSHDNTLHSLSPLSATVASQQSDRVKEDNLLVSFISARDDIINVRTLLLEVQKVLYEKCLVAVYKWEGTSKLSSTGKKIQKAVKNSLRFITKSKSLVHFAARERDAIGHEQLLKQITSWRLASFRIKSLQLLWGTNDVVICPRRVQRLFMEPSYQSIMEHCTQRQFSRCHRDHSKDAAADESGHGSDLLSSINVEPPLHISSTSVERGNQPQDIDYKYYFYRRILREVRGFRHFCMRINAPLNWTMMKSTQDTNDITIMMSSPSNASSMMSSTAMDMKIERKSKGKADSSTTGVSFDNETLRKSLGQFDSGAPSPKWRSPSPFSISSAQRREPSVSFLFSWQRPRLFSRPVTATCLSHHRTVTVARRGVGGTGAPTPPTSHRGKGRPVSAVPRGLQDRLKRLADPTEPRPRPLIEEQHVEMMLANGFQWIREQQLLESSDDGLVKKKMHRDDAADSQEPSSPRTLPSQGKKRACSTRKAFLALASLTKDPASVGGRSSPAPGAIHRQEIPLLHISDAQKALMQMRTTTEDISFPCGADLPVRLNSGVSDRRRRSAFAREWGGAAGPIWKAAGGGVEFENQRAHALT